MADSREQERARKLAQGPTRSAFDKDKEDLARQKEQDRRDASVNNERTRRNNPTGTTHLPTPARSRKDILKELE